ncbi:MAG: type II toxin-antitoxin system RelE/ParE family toxin [Massilia sp.]
MAIRSFRCKQTKKLFEGKAIAKFAHFHSIAERKLQLLDSAASLEFLRSPPGNRLELLSGDRKGQYSIRINDQFRICFVWTDKGPHDVEIVDYH